VLDFVIEKSNQVFKDLKNFDIHDDVYFLNKLSPETKIRFLAQKSPKETKIGDVDKAVLFPQYRYI
jgi:hypothetical protein